MIDELINNESEWNFINKPIKKLNDVRSEKK